MKTFPILRPNPMKEGYFEPAPLGDLLTATHKGEIIHLWEMLGQLHDVIARDQKPDSDEPSDVESMEYVLRSLLVGIAEKEGIADILNSWEAGRKSYGWDNEESR